MKYNVTVNFKKDDEGVLAWLDEYPHIQVRNEDLQQAVNRLQTRLIIELDTQIMALRNNNVVVVTKDMTAEFEAIKAAQNGTQESDSESKPVEGPANEAAIKGTD